MSTEQTPGTASIKMETKDHLVTVVATSGLPHIDGRMCSYETEKIRKKIQEFAEVNDVFILPKSTLMK